MKLYNSLKRKIEDFTPHDGKTARIYSCGPTVYDHAHIGNLSAYIFADTLRRVLAQQMPTKQVMNYTDIDDKTIRRSQDTYPNENPNTALHQLTDTYIKLFLEDMQKIGNDTSAITFVRATDAIEGMKQLTKKLHKAGYAYIADDGVYFSIAEYQKNHIYGQLMGERLTTTARHRISNDEYDKDDASDFALWKKRKPAEPAWELKLDGIDLTGRPGWHIECSVMSRQELGQPFDIHTGGVDLIFPHHENEIAQSTAIEQNPLMAHFFAHNEHVLVDGKKMAKSAKNFYTLQDVIVQGFDPLAFRLLILQAHYRTQIKFSWDNLSKAQARLKRLQDAADILWQPKKIERKMNRYTHIVSIKAAMEDDLNTPIALTLLNEVMKDILRNLISSEEVEKYKIFLQSVDELFGLELSQRENITPEQQDLIAGHEKAHKSKDFARSDELRETLKQQGIGVRDTAHGAIWYRL